MQSSFEEGLFPYDEMPFIFPHSSALSPGEKNAGDLNFHYVSFKVSDPKKRGGG
jgi:hypothetical protein